MSTKKQTRNTKAGLDPKAEVVDAGRKSYLSPAGIREFLKEVHGEFKKIVWPGRKVTAGLTAFVLVLVVVLSIYLGSVDLLLGKLVSTVLK